MTIAATAWALETDRARTPVERLVLILMADCADDFGVVSFSPARLARQAGLTLDELSSATAGLIADGTLDWLPGAAEAWERECGATPSADLEFFFLEGWDDRRRLGRNEPHPELGRIALPGGRATGAVH